MSVFNFKKDKKTPAEGLRLPTGGRSSKEEPVSLMGSIRQYHTWLDGIGPELPEWFYQFCERVSIVNPDMSQAVKNWVNMANTGHQIIIEAASDSIVEKAIKRINELSYSLYKISAGVDGLLNHYLAQMGRMGAISSEDELNQNHQGIRRVHIVPVRKIRFKYEDEDYKPYQLLSSGDMIPLNEVTYHIYCYDVIENSPYPKPPMIAAIEPVLAQRDMVKNIQFIARKLGLLGLVALTLTPPPKKPTETDAEYRARSETYSKDIMDSLQKNFYQGLMVKYKDQTVEHFNITGEARGAKDVFQTNEEQVFSGIGTDPAMHGRSYSTTETYAGVVYNLLVNASDSYRRLAKRRHENTCRLDLLTMGIPIDSVILQWNPIPGMNRKDQEEAEGKRIENILKKRDEGIINQETAAQEIGYDEPWLSDKNIRNRNNPALHRETEQKRKARFLFSKSKQQYIPQKEVINLSKTELSSVDDTEFNKRIKRYLNAMLPFNKQANEKAASAVVDFLHDHKFEDFKDEKDFARRIANLTEGIVSNEMISKEVKAKIAIQVMQIYTFFRLDDKSLFNSSSPLSLSFDKVDDRALGFLEKIDKFYMGKYVKNTGVRSPFVNFLREQYLERGKSVFDPDQLDDFRRLLRKRLIDLTEVQARRIVNTSVARMRNWGHVGQLYECGIKTATYYNPDPVAEICRYLAGKKINVPNMRKGIEKLSAMSPAEFDSWLHQINPPVSDMNSFALEGEAIPPFHPECKTRLIVE